MAVRDRRMSDDISIIIADVLPPPVPGVTPQQFPAAALKVGACKQTLCVFMGRGDSKLHVNIGGSQNPFKSCVTPPPPHTHFVVVGCLLMSLGSMHGLYVHLQCFRMLVMNLCVRCISGDAAATTSSYQSMCTLHVWRCTSTCAAQKVRVTVTAIVYCNTCVLFGGMR